MSASPPGACSTRRSSVMPFRRRRRATSSASAIGRKSSARAACGCAPRRDRPAQHARRGGRILPFGSARLQLVVREAYLEIRGHEQPRPLELDHLVFEPPESILLLSKMEDARLYLDGPYRQIPVGLGDRVMCRISDEPLTVFGLGRRRAPTTLRDASEPPASSRPSRPKKSSPRHTGVSPETRKPRVARAVRARELASRP